VKRLNTGIETCVKAGDNGSRDLLRTILADEEQHIDWLEGQLHAIGEIGLENHLAQQLHETKEHETKEKEYAGPNWQCQDRWTSVGRLSPAVPCRLARLSSNQASTV
jgi:hypothetical protein